MKQETIKRILSSIIIGVGVDFSIHYCSEYKNLLENKKSNKTKILPIKALSIFLALHELQLAGLLHLQLQKFRIPLLCRHAFANDVFTEGALGNLQGLVIQTRALQAICSYPIACEGQVL